MTHDPHSDRIIVVDQQRTSFRIAAKRARATRFGSFRRPPAASGRRLRTTSLTARGGQITVALENFATTDGTPDGLYVITGRQPSRIGGLTKVPGTTRRDTSYWHGGVARGIQTFLVAAAGRDRVVLAWQRDNRVDPSWDARQQGLWMTRRVRNPKTGAWRFLRAQHVTGSAYDELDSLVVDRRRRAHLGYRR